jgi:hypothetical protein
MDESMGWESGCASALSPQFQNSSFFEELVTRCAANYLESIQHLDEVLL